MSDFLQDFFINPLLANGWFNPINTLLWGVILVAAAYLTYTRILKRMKIKVDRYFTLAILPFIFWASSTRVLRDLSYSLARQASGSNPAFLTDIAYQTSAVQQAAYGHISGFLPFPACAGLFSWVIALFPTPGSYVFTFLFALGALLLSLGIQKVWKIPYWKPMFMIGFVFSAFNALIIPWTNPQGAGMILGITACFAAGFFGLTYLNQRMKPAKPASKRKGSWFLKPLAVFSGVNSSILSAHMLDSSATFVSVTFFGYLEQHPVPRFFIESAGGWTFFVLKLAVLLPSLYIIDKYAEKGDFRNFLKIIILILGLAPGLRDALRLAAGV